MNMHVTHKGTKTTHWDSLNVLDIFLTTEPAPQKNCPAGMLGWLIACVVAKGRGA